MLNYGLPKDQLEKYWSSVYDEFVRQIGLITLHVGAKEILSLAKKLGVKIAVFTRSKREILLQMMQVVSIKTEIFEKIVAFEDVKYTKPDPEGIIMILNDLQITKNEAIIVGDSDHEILAGQNGGIDTVNFFPDHHDGLYTKQDFDKLRPTFQINSLSQLEAIIFAQK